MASKIKILKELANGRGDYIGPLLPANWIELKGQFSPAELITIAAAVQNNFIKANGGTKRRNFKLGIEP